MSSVSDLTARARIRDAAITLFAERGVGGATIREIAQQAGVSSGLLRHHFGSKEGLRDACDEYALNELTSLGARFTDMQMDDRIRPETLLLQRYVVSSLLDGSPAGELLFDRMIEYGLRWLDATDLKVEDPRAFVAVISAMKMSMFTMRDQLSRVLGEDVGAPAGWARIIWASIEIFSQPLVSPELAEQAYTALDRFKTPKE